MSQNSNDDPELFYTCFSHPSTQHTKHTMCFAVKEAFPKINIKRQKKKGKTKEKVEKEEK